MLGTGSNVNRALSTKIFLEGCDVFVGEVGVVFSSYTFENICWRIKALSPSYNTEMANSPDQVRELVASFDLPDLMGIAPLVQRINGTSNKVKSGSPLFKTPPNELQKSLNLWLKRYSPEGRITSNKLGNALWNQVWLKFGDAATHSIIKSDSDKLDIVLIGLSPKPTRCSAL